MAVTESRVYRVVIEAEREDRELAFESHEGGNDLIVDGEVMFTLADDEIDDAFEALTLAKNDYSHHADPDAD
jgi:hypothetical protein